jgi:Subtilase family
MPDWDIIVYDPSRPRPTPALDAPAFSRLPMVAVAHGSARPDVGQPLAVRERYDISYVRLLQGIDFCLEQRADVLNLSLGPARPLPSTREDPDPLYVATDVARQLGMPVIVAAGNKGPAPDTLQFLARAEWVVAVGATDDQGRLLDSSSRGVPGGRTPTIVSDGTISRPDPMFPKPSTSWATSKVAAVAGWTKLLLMLVAKDVRDLIAGRLPAPEVPVPVIGICDTGFDPKALPEEWKDTPLVQATVPRTERQGLWYRKVLEWLEQMDLAVQIRNDPMTVSLALGLMATPLPQYQPFEVGQGFVWTHQLLTFFAGFAPSRFALLFCDPSELSKKNPEDLLAMDDELGPLWDDEQSQILEAHVCRGCFLIMARVY